MTDKQIIIDGCDVNRCEKQGETINGITCGNGTKIRLADRYIYKYKLCKDNPNCLFKQLARKTQECEELKDKIKFMEGYIKTVENAIDELERENKFSKEQAEQKLEKI